MTRPPSPAPPQQMTEITLHIAKKCTRAEIVVVWGEGVSESLWKHHKSKEHEILHWYRYSKKIAICFLSWRKSNLKNIFQKQIWISEKHIFGFFSIEMSFKIDFSKIDFKWHFNWKKSQNIFFENSDFFFEKYFSN